MGLDNPAGRLLAILERGRKISPDTLQGTAWAQLLQCDAGDQAAIVSRLGLVMRLPGDIRREVDRLDLPNSELFVKDLGEIEGAFGRVSLQTKWRAINDSISDVAMNSLGFTSFELDRHSSLVDQAQLIELSEHVRALRVAIVESVGNGELAAVLLTYVDAIQAALDEYYLTGRSALLASVERAWGGLLIHREEIESEASNDPDLMEKVRTFAEHLKTIALLLGASEQIAQIGGTILGALPPG